MNQVYILIITHEAEEEFPLVQLSVYRDMDGALKAYDFSVDEARADANENYNEVYEEDEICTDSYRFFRIYDYGHYKSTTIEVKTKEIIGDDSDDI